MGAKTLTLAVSTFMLAWTHTVEKTEWQEDWAVVPGGFTILEARVKGSGAGMEPPDDAVLQNGWWRYTPKLGIIPRLNLTNSGEGDWRICAAATCAKLETDSTAAESILIVPCRASKPNLLDTSRNQASVGATP